MLARREFDLPELAGWLGVAEAGVGPEGSIPAREPQYRLWAHMNGGIYWRGEREGLLTASAIPSTTS